jgi:RNA polymerase sigma-70 factor (ECF subfamily)
MEEFLQRTRPRLLAAARRIGNPQEAEDCVQAAYHSLLRRGDTPTDAPQAWLAVAVVRIAYRRKALSRREERLAERLALDRGDSDPERAAEKRETARLLRSEVARLPAKYRDVVVLHYLEGLSVGESARLLEVPSPTVQTRLRRARRLLEGRLAPWAARCLLFIPWILADTTRAAVAGPAAIGGTMKFKSAVIIAGVGLASGAVGLGVGASWSPTEQAGPAGRAARSGEGAQVAHLMLELDAARAQAAELTRQLAERSDAGAERPSAGEATGGGRSRAISTEAQDRVVPIPEAIQRAAKATGVTTPAVRAALKAKKLLQELSAARNSGAENIGQLEVETHDALAALKGYGEEGYLAVLALLRGGESGLYFTRLLKETWAPGWEPHLQALVVDAGVPVISRSTAMQGLGVADTHEVRRFLVDYVERSDDPSLFYSAAGALGTLGESEGARFVADKLQRQGWEGVRPHLFVALGGMGGDDAREIILGYLEKPSATTDLFYAVAALTRIDSDAAAEQAQKILDGPQGAKLSEIARKYMELWAGRN